MPEITYVEAINQALHEEMARDDRVFIMGEEIGPGGVFGAAKGLLEKFGEERVRTTPICEAALIGAGVGAALTGMRPIVELMVIDFITCGMDQIANQAAKLHYMSGGQARIPLVVRTATGSKRHRAAQHSQCLEAWFVHTPGLLVIMPSCPYDAKGLLKTSVRTDDPVLFVENSALYYEPTQMVPEEEYTIPLAEAEIKREGDDVTVVATSRMVNEAITAAERLEAEGVSVEVIDPRTLVPLDKETILESVKKTTRLVVAYEAVEVCGWGAEICALAAKEAFYYLDAPIERVGARYAPIPFAPKLEEVIVPGAREVERAIRSVLGIAS